LILLAATARNDATVRILLPRDVSLDGHLVDGALGYLTIATGIAFVAALGVLLAALVLHRARAGRTWGQHTHGNRARDRALTFAVALILFLAVDVTLAARANRELEESFWRYPDRDPAALRVEVMARQWAWSFRTAGPDGRFGTPDDVVSVNELDVPVGRPVYVKLRSRDVIHSFYLPSYRFKIDAIPGSTTRAWFQAAKPGTTEIGCAQHCGVNHYKMRGLLIARPPAQYGTWLARAETESRLRYDAAAGSAADAWDWETGR
jgi:cytochrome c oxidase subunit 2